MEKKTNKNNFTVQIRINAVLDVEVSAETIDEALKIGNDVA